MPTRPTLKVAAVFAVLLVFLVGAVAVQSQQRRRRAPSRRVTNPVSPSYVPAPSPTAAGEPRLVSTAEETAAQEDPAAARRERRNRQTPAEQQQQQDAATRRALEQISNEVTQLNKKVETMERERRVDVLQERLTRAEQRVEGLQQQLRDVMSKESDLQLRADQIDEQMRPENLDRQIATFGTFRPDEARESLRRQLDNEKKRVRAQLDLYATSRTQLENSLNSAQQFAERLRTQLDDATRREAEDADATDAAPARTPFISPLPRPTATPTATPPPPV